MYKQNCVSNPVHMSCQILPYAAGCHLTPPANKDNPSSSLTSCSPSPDAQATGGCSVGGGSFGGAPRHLQIPTGTNQELRSKPRNALGSQPGAVPSVQALTPAVCRGALKGKAPGYKVSSAGCVPATSKGSFFLQLPWARHAYGEPVWQDTCEPKGNTKTSHLLICQQLASLQWWEHSRDLFIMVLTLHHTWTLGLHTKPLCLSAALLSPKG